MTTPSNERTYTSLRSNGTMSTATGKRADNSTVSSSYVSTSSSSFFSPFTSNFSIPPPFQQPQSQVQAQSHNDNNNTNNNTIHNDDKKTISREQALDEANNVVSTLSYQNAHLENFNLSSVVMMTPNLHQIHNQQQQRSQNHDNATTPSSTHENSSIISGIDLSSLFLDSSTNLFHSVSESLSKEITLLNSAIHSYSRTYLSGGGDSNYISSSNGNIINSNSYSIENGMGGGGGSSSSGGLSQILNNLSLLDYEQQLLLNDYLSTATSTHSSSGGGSSIGEVKIRSIDELPKELTNMDLSQVESYLRKCGMLAYKFDKHCKQQEQEQNQKEDQEDYNLHDDKKAKEVNNHDHNIEKNDNTSNKNEEEDDDIAISMIPDIFFSPYFDLTDPKTFESLLVLNGDNAKEENIGNDNINNDNTKDNVPTLNLPKPEELTQYLDVIELSLLNQVRSKSDSFFRETNRFSYLKSLVADLVDEVKTLRDSLDVIKQRSVTEVELIPILDRRRKDIQVLGSVLNEIGHVLDVKSSVVGLIACGDYLGAVEAIHKARSLLNGDEVTNVGEDDGSVVGEGRSQRFSLGKIVALNKVSDQLAQYENLVVMDLSNNVAELFLSWSEGTTDIVTREKVKNTIIALKKCKKLSTMSEVYREKICETIRVTIRTIVAECAVDAAKDSKDTTPLPSATIVSIPAKDVTEETNVKTSITKGITSMNFDQFMDCLDMIFEQSLSLLQSASAVNKFCLEEGISLKEDENARDTRDTSALSAASDLSHKSISEILRLRKDAHSLITFEDMRRLWDSCLAFTSQVERVSGQKAYGLRSTLLAQAKAFVERKHESNMSSLVAALDGERWNQCDVSAERQASLERLCTGRAVLSSSRDKGIFTGMDAAEASPFACVEGTNYRVVWSCLLLIEHIMSNVACAAHFQTLATNMVGKVSELLRLFNTRSTQLVLGAGAIHSAARLKSINAKHLALVTQCVGITLAILPHVRAALMAQLPSKQHALLSDLDKIKKEYAEHHDKVLSKFVGIIGGIVEHNLVSRVANTNFDERSQLDTGEDADKISCCQFLDGIITNTRKMHQVLVSLLPADDLMNVFSRIFSYLDSKVPKILIDSDLEPKINFQFPSTIEGKRRMVMEVKIMSITLNELPNVRPWDFGAMQFLERKLEIPSSDGNNNEKDEKEENKMLEGPSEGLPIESPETADSSKVVLLESTKTADNDKKANAEESDAEDVSQSICMNGDNKETSNEIVANGTGIDSVNYDETNQNSAVSNMIGDTIDNAEVSTDVPANSDKETNTRMSYVDENHVNTDDLVPLNHDSESGSNNVNNIGNIVNETENSPLNNVEISNDSALLRKEKENK